MSSFSLSNKYYLQYQNLDFYQVHCMAPWGNSVLGLSIYQSWTKASRVGGKCSRSVEKKISHPWSFVIIRQQEKLLLSWSLCRFICSCCGCTLGGKVAYVKILSWGSPSSDPNWGKLSWFELILTPQLPSAKLLAPGTKPSCRITLQWGSQSRAQSSTFSLSLFYAGDEGMGTQAQLNFCPPVLLHVW